MTFLVERLTELRRHLAHLREPVYFVSLDDLIREKELVARGCESVEDGLKPAALT